jgi:hypothetical protein
VICLGSPVVSLGDFARSSFGKSFDAMFLGWPDDGDLALLKDFFKVTLRIRPEGRPTAKELAEHKWFTTPIVHRT